MRCVRCDAMRPCEQEKDEATRCFCDSTLSLAMLVMLVLVIRLTASLSRLPSDDCGRQEILVRVGAEVHRYVSDESLLKSGVE